MATRESFYKKYGSRGKVTDAPMKQATKPTRQDFLDKYSTVGKNKQLYSRKTDDENVIGLTQSIAKESLYNPDEAFEPYPDYLNRVDYKEKSQYSSSAKRDGFWKTIGMDGSDETYEFINDVDGAREKLVAKYKEGNGTTELEQHGYQYMTDEEKGVYNYKYAVEGKESADKYLKDLEISLNKRVYDKSTETWEKWANDSAVKSAAMSLASPITSMAGGIGSGIETIKETVTGEKYNPYAPGRVAANATSDIRQYVGENIAESTEGMEVFGQNIPQFLYQTGMSIADSSLGAATLGRAFTPIMGMNAYQQKAKEMTEAGEDESVVQRTALASGIAEALFEYVSIDKLLKIKNVDGIKNAVKSTLAQMGVEGSEEVFTEVANILSDTIIRGDGSDIKKQYDDLIAKGYSPSEANTEVAKQIGSQIGWAFVGGALSGGVMGGAQSYAQYHNLSETGARIRENDRVSEMMDVSGDAFMSLSEKDAYNLYTEYAKSGVTAENITDVQLGNLYSSVAQNIDDVTRSKKATPQEQNDIRRQIEGLETVNKAKTTKMADTGKAVNIEGVKSVDGERVLQTSEGEVKTKDVKLSHTDAELMSYAEGMDDSKANLMLSQYDGKSDVEAYVNSFNLAYSYGETGFGTDFVLKNKGVLTERQALNAYKEATMAKARKNAEAFENAVNKTITREMLGGRFDDSIIDYDGSGKGTVKWNMLTSSEKMNINAAKVIAGAMKNTKFEFIESRVENGEYKGENARWNPTTRTISIDVHAGRNKLTDENSYIMSAMSHEITHSFERTAAEEYANLRDHVMNYLANRNGIDASELIARKRMQIGDSHAKRGIELTDERVINEIVADACEEMLVNSKKVDEYLKGMDEHTKKSFVGKVKETFENIIKAINDVIKKLDPRTKEARALRESKEDFEKTLELWDKAFVKANESHVESISTDIEINDSLNEIGLEFDSETKTVFSLRSLEDAFNYNDAEGYLRSREEYVNALVKATGRTKAEAERYLNSLFLVHDMIARDKDRLDYEAAVNRTAWVSNSEYGGSIDFSTLCAKRRIFTGTFDAIQNALPNTVLTDKDYLEIRNLLLKKGKESPCSMCYVEGSRAKAGEYINKWLQEYLKTNPKWRPRIADFASATGLEKTRIQHPEAYNAYQEAMNKLAQRKPKEASVRTDYKGEILVAFSDGSSVEIKNLNGGIRFNSFSDFEIVHTLDCMQVIADMARVGLAGQGYTKVKEFAKCFGNTGMKINLSLVAKDVDANGKLIMDEVNGMSYKDAMELRNEFSENVGTVIVCFNVDQIKAAMADDTIDYILPFHRSQWRKAQYAAMGLPTKTKDFTMFQDDRIRNPKTGRPVKLEKLKHISRYTNDITGESYEIKGNIMPNQYWDYTKSGRENAQRYLDYINQNGMTPKFDFVLEKADGKWVLPNNAIGDGYFKLLIDFKMYNNDGVGTPQLPVTPEFNMPFIEQMLEDYKGGHGSFPVAHDVVDEFVEGYKKNHPKAQYSERTATEEAREFSDVSIQYSIREEAPPKTTAKAYKVFLLKNGQLYPPMVANPGGEGTPVGVWLNADAAPRAEDSKTGRPQVQAGGKGTNTGKMTLAYRPGWHLGDIPQATQFAKKNPETGIKELFPSNFVWAECEYATDVDYQEEAMSYGYNKNGKFQHSLAGLPKIPKDGYYRYRTNPNPDTVPWVITGAMRVNRILTDKETDAICRANGVEPLKRMGGPLTEESLADMGLTKLDHTQYSNRYSEHYHYDKDNVVVIDTKMFSKSKIKKNYKEINSLVRSMLKELVGKQVTIKSDGRVVLFDLSTAKEYTGSVATYSMDAKRRGAKANISIALERIVESAKNPFWTENKKEKHNRDAARGWTYYDLVFGINDADVTEYYSARLVVRMDVNGKDYVYDVDNINEKKEAKLPNELGVRPASDNSLPEAMASVKHSDRYDDVWFDLFDEDGSMAASSAIIDEDVERLRERLSMGASSMSDANIQMIAKHLKKIADSSYDNDELMDELKDIYGYIEYHDYFDGNALISKCNDVARRILSEQREHKVTNDYAKMVLKDIRATKIKLNAEQIAEAKNRYGEKYRNALFGRILISNEGISLDSKWQEWSGQYPSIFSADVNSADMINELADIYDSLREASETGQRFAEVNDVRALGAEIYNQYWIRSTVQTESEKNNQKVKELNLKHRNAMKKLREDYQKRLENQRLADSMHYGKIINEIRQRNKDEVKKAKALGKERMDKYKDRVARNAKIEQITKNAMTLNDWLRKNSKDHHIPEVMKAPVAYLLNAIDFSSKQLLGMNGANKFAPTKTDISLSEALEQVHEMVVNASQAQMEEEFIMDFPPNMQDEIRNLSKGVNIIMRTVGDNAYVLNQMSLEQLESLDSIIKIIKHSVTQMNDFFAVKHSAGVANLSQSSMAYMNSLGKIVEKTGKTSKAVSKLLNWGNITPYYAFKKFGEGGKAVYEALQTGWDTFAFHAKEIIDYAEENYTEKEVKEWSEHVHTFDVLEPASDSERKTPGYKPSYQKLHMTDAQIMALYCLQKRDQAKGHLIGGGIRPTDIDNGKKVISQPDGAMLSESDINTIISVLSPRQIAVADALQEFMNTTCTDWGNEVSMERFGFKAFGEPNYFPIQSDKNNLAVDDAVEQNSLYRLLNMSFTKGTIKNANNRVLIGNIFDVYAQHTSDMAKYNALALPVLDAFKWFNYKEKEFKGDTQRKERSLKQSMEKAFGKDALNYFTTFMRDLNGEKNVARDNLSGIFFTNAKIASVGANIRVVALQPTAYVRASAVIDSKYLRRALLHKPKVDRAEKHCGIALWKSLGYYDVNIQRGLADQIKQVKTPKDKATDFAMKGAELADKVTWGYLWNACELEVRDKRKDLKVGTDEFYKEVGTKLREVIYATQVVDSTMTRSHLMRSNEMWHKMMTSFMSEPTIAYNMLADAYTGWKLTEREIGSKQKAFKAHGKKMARVITAYTMTNMFAALVEAGFDIFRDDEEMTEEAFLEAYIKNFMSDMSVINKIPYAKEITSLLQGYSSSRTDTQWMQYLAKTLEGIQKHLEGKGNVYTTAKNAMRTVSYATGLPIYNAWRDATATLDKTGILSFKEIDEIFNDTIGEIFPSLKSK